VTADDKLNTEQPLDVFVRALNPDGTVQLGIADPDEPYGERSVTVATVTRATAYNLISGLALRLSEEREGAKV
jgi:hypothetical protein